MKTIYALSVAMLLAGLSPMVHCETPESREVSLDIAAQPIEQALNAFAQQAGLQLLFRSESVESGVMGPRLVGTFTPREALARLLANTSLSYKFLDERTVAVRAAGKAESQDKTSQLQEPAAQLRVAQIESAAGTAGEAARSSEALEELEEIVVTGTHIRGTRNDTAPLVVIDRQQIERTGYATTQDLIRSLPQNFVGGEAGASEDGVFGLSSRAGSNFAAATGINLRGLGNSSTLVLLNGHRMAPSVYGSLVDVSLIPLAAIERIEMVLDGSSALYGSDAVGGVVNIITRNDFQGASTSLRYDAAVDSGRSNRTISQAAGGRWDTGNVVATAQYQDQRELRAEDRDFASALTQPNDLLPAAKNYGIALNARQRLADNLELYGDALLSRRDIERNFSFPDIGGNTVGTNDARSRGINAASGLRYQMTTRWSLDLGAQFSEQLSQRRQHQTSPGEDPQSWIADVRFRETAADAVFNGTLFTNRAGAVGVALGGSYREEHLTRHEILLTGDPVPGETRRNVKAAFAEAYVPLIGEANALPLVRSLSISGALRMDDYSTLGSTSTPRIGIHWSPSSQIGIRAAYSRSFRAPDPSEIFNTDVAFIFKSPFEDSNGGVVDALVLTGSRPTLDPERARIVNVGLEYRPQQVPGLTFNADYYHVRYIDRIVLHNFDVNALIQPGVYGSLITPLGSDAEAQDFLDAAIEDGVFFFDDPFNPGVTGVRSAIDFRQQNAALVKQSGIDLRATFEKALATGVLATSATVSTIDKIDTAFAAGAASTDIVNTLGNPVDLRGRLDVSWDAKRWLINGALNYTDGYVNTGTIGTPRIDSWLTFDLTGRLKLDALSEAAALHGASLTLSVQNLFDEKPPFVAAPTVFDVNYDPANANPLKRVIGLELVKAW